jgi:hypothetical protein
MLLELERRLHQRPDLIGKEAGVLVEALEFLPVAFGERGLVIPCVHVARAAVDEQPDHGLRLGRKMANSRRQRIERVSPLIRRGQQLLIGHQRGQR